MSASPQQQLQVAERRIRLVQLKMAGADYESIARQLGYSSADDARKDHSRAMRGAGRRLDESIEEARALELARLDRLQAALWTAAVAGDKGAVETSLKVIDRRCRLLGLDAPTQLEVITTDRLDREILELERKLEANDASAERVRDGETGEAQEAS